MGMVPIQTEDTNVAHNIEFVNGKAQMAYAGDVPWHGLGVQVPADLTPEQMQATVEERLRSGFYTPAQADDLLGLINGRLDWLTGDNGQEFTHEAAEHEVQA